jgi:hypothetical protein
MQKTIEGRVAIGAETSQNHVKNYNEVAIDKNHKIV